MNNFDLAEMAYAAATKYKTMYVMGGYGQPLKNDNIKEWFIEKYEANVKRSAQIMAAPADCFAFDCVCFIKSLINGWCGDLNGTWGGAVYNKVVPDLTCDEMIKNCTDVSAVFKDLVIGELLYLPGHVGLVVSISPALAVEASPKWDSKVQVTSINSDVRGYQRRDWAKHGKMTKWVQYDAVNNGCTADVEKVFEGCTGPYVLTAQRLLAWLNYNPGPLDGKCGPKTVAAIKRFQADHKDLYGRPLEVDGKIFGLTWSALIRGDFK